MGWKRNTFRKWLCSFIVIFFNYDISSSQIDESIAKHKQNFENVAHLLPGGVNFFFEILKF